MVATVSDPHEIANVLGIKGVEYMLENASKVDFNFNFGASSCVPATTFETSGDSLDISDIKELLDNKKINHLGEVIEVIQVIDHKPAVAFVKDFELKKGAIASCVAVGCNDEDIARAVNLIVTSKGGISAVNGKKSLHLPLEVAGIMSSKDGFKVASKYEDLDRFAKKSLGSNLSSPFMTLSFMALLVIPELKLSDKGLFDGRKFHFMPTCVK